MWGNGNHFAMDHNFMKLPHPVNMEFMYDIDILEMIRFFPYNPFFQGIGPPGPIPCIESCDGSFPDDSGNRSSCTSYDECDDSLMVTSNDALRFEEDCLFESPSPSCSNIQTYRTSADAGADSNRFLCQKNFMADMTLAELNDSNASDVGGLKVKPVVTKTVMPDMDQNFDPMNDSFFASTSKTATCTSKNEAVSQILLPKQPVFGGVGKPSRVIKIEQEPNDGLKYENKTESVSPTKCNSKASKSLKRSQTSSVTLTEFEIIDDKRTVYQNSEATSISSSSVPLEKKMKFEITDTNCDRGGSSAATDSPSKNVDSDSDSGDDFSDAESVVSKGSSVQDLLKTNSGDRRFFWQYNVQAKGPKEKRLCRKLGSSDPHVLKDFEDPVFDPGHSNVHFVHSGKARKGDGTDITPNPKKLLQIGSELKTLNNTIEEMMLATDVVTRTTTMKEKNKYASRVCRLKKKAQHEANKIKLQGLNEEHNQLMHVLNSIKSKLKHHKSLAADGKTKFTLELDRLTESCLKVNVAGHADDYVSSILLSTSPEDQKDIWLYSD